MLTKITTTTAVGGVGLAPGQKLFKVPIGEYKGRIVAIVKTSDNDIKLSYADNPYSIWSIPTTIANDSSATTIDAVMDESGNIYVVYCESTTKYLACIKLSYSDGNWTAGSKYYVYNGGATTVPSITIDASGKLRVSFARDVSALFDIQVKSSTDGGQTWGSGSSDIGDTLRSGLTLGIPKILTSLNTIYVVYAADYTELCLRTKPLSGGSWTGEFIISSGVNVDGHFDAAVLPEGLLGVTFDSEQLHYREFDGSNWSGVTVLDSDEGFYPQITFYNYVPVVVYQSALASDQIVLKYTHKATGVFSSPGIFDIRVNTFDKVFLYDATSSSYSDLTAEASNESVGDVFHPSSAVLLKNKNDALYFGFEQKFRFLKSILSTGGVGGTVVYSYWNGSNWIAFTPSGGNFNFDASDKELILWDDFYSVPGDWQKSIVSGSKKFWMKIEVDSQYSVAPIGTMLTPISNITSISLRR